MLKSELKIMAYDVSSQCKDHGCVTSMPVEQWVTQLAMSILLHWQEELEDGLTTRAGLANGSTADLQKQD